MMEKRDIYIALGAYFTWGILPIYWKQLQGVSSLEVLAHRIFWSLVFLLGIMLLTGRIQSFFSDLSKTFQNYRSILRLLLAALLLNVNWLTYIWAVHHSYILQTSLGYYINPIISVILGLLVLREHLSSLQWVSFVLVLLGVALLVFRAGVFPWVSLVLALSFAWYGLLKKRSCISAISSLTLEALVSSVPSLAYIVYLAFRGQSAFLGSFGTNSYYLVGAGIATAFPLILFNMSAKKLPLYMIGFFQYLAPTMTLIVAVFLYRESFSSAYAGAFVLVWAGLACFSGSILRQHYQLKKLRKSTA